MHPKYEEDFYGWAMTNAHLLKEGKYEEVDMEHVIEELEDMGRSQENELFSRLAVLLAHLLKWQYQPNLQSRSWKSTLEEQRFRIQRLLRKNPGLKKTVEETLRDGYQAAILSAGKESGLNVDVFPEVCPFTLAQCLDETFYPA